MIKIAIIGAGVSGLGIAQQLKDKFDVTVFESASRPGGLIKCTRIKGKLFHNVGGHVFNSNRKDVLEWFWNFFDKNDFLNINRNAIISLEDNRLISYPIENHIYQLNENEIKEIIKDFLNIQNLHNTYDNFEEFLRGRFGNTLFKLYFQPYNKKIWNKDLNEIPLSWLLDKLPMPSVDEMLLNNIQQKSETKMAHSNFWYAKNNGSQFIVDNLSKSLNIVYNSHISKLKRIKNKWAINDIIFDKIIFCGNIKELPTLLSEIDLNKHKQVILNLASHGTTTVFCEIDSNPYTWVYMPSNIYKAHRFICTGNYANSNNVDNKLTASLEFTGYVSKSNIIKELKKIPFAPKYITHNYTPFTYPIQSESTRSIINSIKTDIEKENIYLLGRFAEWEYYNMDTALGAGIDLANKIKQTKQTL